MSEPRSSRPSRSTRPPSPIPAVVTPTPDLRAPLTLAIDVGGTGLKAAILDADGVQAADRVRVATAYPCPPAVLVAAIQSLVRPLPSWDRVSVGFPGMVRAGRVLSAPHFITVAGPGSKVSPALSEAWAGFELATAVEAALGKPTRVANDADVQGAAVVGGEGLELVVTLGTGVGTALFSDGLLAPHLELSQHPFRKGQTYNDQLGEAARKRVGTKKWNRRVNKAVATLDALVFFDHLYIGGGNASKLTIDLGTRASVVSNTAGVLGGIKLWERSTP